MKKNERMENFKFYQSGLGKESEKCKEQAVEKSRKIKEEAYEGPVEKIRGQGLMEARK